MKIELKGLEKYDIEIAAVPIENYKTVYYEPKPAQRFITPIFLFPKEPKEERQRVLYIILQNQLKIEDAVSSITTSVTVKPHENRDTTK